MALRNLAANGLVAGAACLAMALAGELACRLLERHGLLAIGADAAVFPEVSYTGKFRASSNPILRHELDPADPEINADGFRDRLRSIEKPPGSVRIAALGDSVTFGRGVPAEEAYPRVLERLLQESETQGVRYEVLNLGVGGYNTRQELELYRSKGRRYRPDLLLLAYTINDVVPAEEMARGLRASRSAAGAGGRFEPGADPEGRPPRAGLLERFRLLAFLRDRIGRLPGLEPALPVPWQSFYADPLKWRVVAQSFAELAAIAEADGTRVLVVIFPMLEDFEEYELLGIHQLVRRGARRHGLAVLDLYPSYRAFDAEHLRQSRRDTTHPNALGHRLAAGWIRDHLVRSGWLAEAR